MDTPAAITAISSTEIEDKGITNMHDLKHLVPSMNFTNVLGAQTSRLEELDNLMEIQVSRSVQTVFSSPEHIHLSWVKWILKE